MKQRSKEYADEINNTPYFVVSTQADPVRNGPVLPHLLRKLLLDNERLMRRLRNRGEEDQGLKHLKP